MTHLLALEAGEMGVEGLFSYLTPSIKLHTFHVSAFFKRLCFHSLIFHHSSSFFVSPFPWAPGGRGHSGKERALRGGCPGMVVNIGWATQGSVRDVLPLLVSSVSNQNHQELPFFFTALFSAYLGATVTNMLSVVSSVLAKVFLPQRQIWTFWTFGHFPGLWGRTPRLREQFSQRRNGSGRGDTVCPGGWCGSHWNRPLWSPLFILRACMNCHSSALNTSEIITWLYFVPEAIEKRALHICKEISNLV